MSHKRGQYAGNAAAFIAVLTVLIILYILFLPPDIRTELLGDKNAILGNNTNGTNQATVLLKENVGTVTYINTNEKTYDLPTTRIYSPTSGQVIKSAPSVLVRYPIFDPDRSTYTVEFNIDRVATKNVLLSFNVEDHVGPLRIVLNGRDIFNGEITSANPKPIPLDQDYLMGSNTLTVSVPTPGLRFWKANSYTITNLQITADVTDYSSSIGVQHFILSRVERENLEGLKLHFYPSCAIKDVGPLKIEFNGQTVYNTVADCGSSTFTILNVNDAIIGSNELKFSSAKGSYLLDNMYVKTTMSKPAYKTFYFDMGHDYFIEKDKRFICGDYDNECPSGCDETQDADCCFERNGFWCSLATQDDNNRCRFYVADDDCDVCKTGYYDKSGNTPNNCEHECGDNNDDACPAACPQPGRYYDRDCCYAQNEDNFWCKETPVTGINDKCKLEVSPNDCDLCPSGYIDIHGNIPLACDYTQVETDDRDFVLSSDYEVKLTVRFVDGMNRKRVDVNINGHMFRVDTTGVEYSKIISTYVQEDTNSVEIIPVSDTIEIAEIKVELRKIR